MSRLRLLCCDLDGTLIPNGLSPERAGARQRFARWLARSEVRLAYVSGRSFPAVLAAIRQWRLPQPEVILADVGTRLYWRRGRRWQSCPRWRAQLARQWPPGTGARLRTRLAGLPGLQPQPPAQQGIFKQSWFVSPSFDPCLVEQRLAGSVPLQQVWSRDVRHAHGLLDLLPAAAGKRATIEWLMAHWRLRPEQVCFAGDSGNDLDVLVSPIPAVLVGNAEAALRAEALELARCHGTAMRLYPARAHYADGVLEGVRWFGTRLGDESGRRASGDEPVRVLRSTKDARATVGHLPAPGTVCRRR